MKSLHRRIIELALLFGLAGQASAATIDTTATFFFNNGAFGEGGTISGTATYGETFTAPDLYLTNFSLYLQQRFEGTGTLDVRGYIGAWTGTQVSSVLYESPTRTMNAAGTLQEFAFAPGFVGLTVGQQYVAYLSISNLSVPATPNTFGMPIAGQVYSGGDFVFSNNDHHPSDLVNFAWSCTSACAIGPNDAWFKATFVAVPGPTAGAGLPGLVAASCGFVVWWRRRRKAPVQRASP